MKTKYRSRLAVIFCIGVTVGLLIWGKRFSTGVTDGLALAAGVFIPAMLPYYFVVALVGASLAGLGIRRITSPLCRKMRFSEAAGSVMLMGLLGGYPAGAMAVGDACQKGELDAGQAQRLMLFCTNAGPGFVIGAVGEVMLGSTKAGILLYCAHLLATLTIMIVSNCKAKPLSKPAKSTARPLPFAVALTESVVKASHSCLYAAGFIALSCGVISVLSDWLGTASGLLLPAVCALMEVTKGCLELAHATSLPPLTVCVSISAALGFGGVSVLLQVASFCGRWVNFATLLKARIISALLNAGYCLLLCFCIGVPELTVSATHTMAAITSEQQVTAHLLIVIGLALAVAQQTEKILGVSFPEEMCYNKKNGLRPCFVRKGNPHENRKKHHQISKI